MPQRYTLPKDKKPSRFGRAGRWIAAGVAATALGVGALRAVLPMKVPLAKERSAIGRIYHLNEKNSVDKKVLDLLDGVSKKEGISRKRTLLTLEQNLPSGFEQIMALENRIRSEKGLDERSRGEIERLRRIQRILAAAMKDKEVSNRLEEALKTSGSLREVDRLLK